MHLGEFSLFRSIRWKFIIIYFVLVFIAMSIIGVFIIKEFEDYHLMVVSERLNTIALDYILPDIEKIPFDDNLKYYTDDIQSIIDRWSSSFYREEIFVIDRDFTILSSSNGPLIGQNAVYELEESLLISGLKGERIEKDKKGDRPTKNIVLPITRNNKVVGVLYVRDYLGDIYETLDESKDILTEATVFALAITVVLGYLIARSITEPINDLTHRASKMAKGDFDQRVEVKSDDEIGNLAEMFNYLIEKLKITLGEMESEKSKLETILNYMADGLIAVNLEGKIIHVNPKAYRLLGLKDDIVNKDFDDIFKDINPNFLLNKLLEKNEDWIGRENIKVGDSILSVDYAPFKNEKNERGGLVLLIQDITEQQKLEDMRKEFVANVSHELKTPLTSIKSYAETLLNGAIENRDLAMRFLRVIDNESDRMTRLVRDLLQLSNFDSKKVKLNIKENDYVQLIKQALIKLEITAKNKGQKVEFNKDLDSLYGKFDYDKLEQVILNIVSNSIKYTPEEGEIKVSLTEEQAQALITVEDNGIGIPEEDIPRLFERFYRVDKARSRELGGTGLGLSIAKEIVEYHGGTIEIYSKIGEGTKVVIKVPLQVEV